MIKVKLFGDDEVIGYEISGHAGFAKFGQDIICAAVSCLHLSLIAVLESEGVPFEYDDSEIKKLTIHGDSGKPHLKMFYVGMRCLEKEYPDYISLSC